MAGLAGDKAMSKFIGVRLPPKCLRAFDGHDLEREYGEAHLLLTSDPDGMPRPCMLSAGEMLAIDDRTIRVALWPGSHTSANLRRDGRALICFVAAAAVLYIRGRAATLSPAHDQEIERFEIKVESVEGDAHEGMPVKHGIGFGSSDEMRRAMLDSWSKVLKALREA